MAKEIYLTGLVVAQQSSEIEAKGKKNIGCLHIRDRPNTKFA